MSFVIRKFDYQETLGEKLKAIRRCANLTLSELAASTKIRKTFLKAFETGDYAKLPDSIYARNYLKKYVRALGGNTDYFLEQFEKECGTCDFTKNARLPRARTRTWQFIVASRFVQVFVICALAIAVTLYLGYELRAIISAPELTVFEPQDGYTTQDALIKVTGVTETEGRVKVNGADVLLSQNGRFETEVALERGLNVITIESSKRYSHPAIEYRRVVLEEEGKRKIGI